MKRYPHFMRRAKAAKYPARLVGLDVDCTDDASDGNALVVREELVRWHAYGSVLHDGSECGRWQDGDKTYCQFWESVEWCCRQPGNTLVVSFGAARVWGVLGLWDKLEQGVVSIDGKATIGEGKAGNPLSELLHDMQSDRRTASAPVQVPGQVPSVCRQDDLDGRTGERSVRRNRQGSGLLVIEDPPTIITVRMPGRPGTLTICDLRNWGIHSHPHSATCQRRSLAVLEVMLRLVEIVRSHEWGSLRLTAGSQALHTYCHSHLSTPIHVHTVQSVLNMEQAGYYGGRCEVRKMGRYDGICYHLDYRNLYASVCAAREVPVSLLRWGEGRPAVSEEAGCRVDDMLAEVTITTDKPNYPFRRDGMTIWPIGTFQTTLAGPELLLAFNSGHILQWHSWASYRRENVLATFANDVWAALEAERTSGSKQVQEWLKSLLVCLPGKLGQRGNSWEPYPGAMAPAPWCYWDEVSRTGEVTRCRSLGWRCEREVKYQWAQEAVPAIAAWITSYGRIALLEAIETAGREQCLYWDTDSVIVTATGYHRLRCSNILGTGELGRLREIECGVDLDIRGVKDYTLCQQRKCSGEPHGTIYPAQLPGHYWYVDWLRRQVQRGEKPSQKRILRQYARDGSYRHGIVGDDGWVRSIRL